MPIFVKGLIVGFLIALPVGPVAIVCIHRTLVGSKRHGLISGLGAATADAFYGAIAALGLSVTEVFLTQHATAFRILGGIALWLLGIKTFFSRGSKTKGPDTHALHAGNFLSTFLITLMNPMTIVAFAIVFASSGLHAERDRSAVMLIGGVFCGSALWWLALSVLAGAFSSVVNEERMSLINKTAGTLIILLGAVVMFRENPLPEAAAELTTVQVQERGPVAPTADPNDP